MLVSKIDQMKAFIWKKKINCYSYTLQLIVFWNVLFHLIDFWNMLFHLIGFSMEGSVGTSQPCLKIVYTRKKWLRHSKKYVTENHALFLYRLQMYLK